MNHGLLYTKNDESDDKAMIGYSDAEWAGDANDWKSTSGYMFMVSGTPVSWRSKKQTCVVRLNMLHCLKQLRKSLG